MKTTLDYNGENIQELAKKIINSPQRGYTTVRTFRGREEYINAKAAELFSLGYQTQVTEGPLYQLEATIGSEVDSGGTPDTGELVVQWELLQTPQEKEILKSNSVAVNYMPAHYKKIIEDSIKNQTGELALPVEDGVVNGISLENHRIAARQLWDLMMHGYTTTITYQPTLRRTVTPYINYPLTGFVSNVGKIYRTNTLISVENIPANFAYVLPTDEDPAAATVDGLNLKWGWLKQSTSVLQISNQKLQVSQDWVYGLYSYIIYGDPL